MGRPTQDIGHLAGRDDRKAAWSPWMRNWDTVRKPVEWLLRASGGQVIISAGTPRAGTHRVTLELPV